MQREERAPPLQTIGKAVRNAKSLKNFSDGAVGARVARGNGGLARIVGTMR